MCGADSSASHIRLIPSHRGSPPSGCPEDRLLWPNMAARLRRTERAKALRLACWNADGVRGRKLELEHFLNQHGVDICVRHSSTMVKPSGLQNCLPPHRQPDHRGRYSHPGPPLYGPPLSTHSGTDPLGGYCHPGQNVRQTGENSCGLSLPFPPTDRSGPVSLFRRGNPGLDGRRLQRKTRGLELAAELKKGETPA